MTTESLRLVCFLGLFSLFAFLELYFPRRKLHESKKNRWMSNLGMIAVGSICVALLKPLSAIAVAVIMETHQKGLYNYLVYQEYLNKNVALILGFITLDLAIYVQHIIFHKVDILWKIHRVHHIDKDLDVSSGLRFHPVEIIFSLAIKIAVITFFGISPLSVLVFEIILNGTSLFNHSNLNISTKVDKFLRHFIVTPDMHRIHHSVYENETNSNYGFNFPWWDYLFKTYTAEPRDGQMTMKIGLSYFRSKKYIRLLLLLALPFLNYKKLKES